MNESTENIALQMLPNFDTSVIIPLGKDRWSGFTQLFPLMAKYYQRNGIEMLLVIDKTIDKDSVLAFIKYFLMIDWKVVECDAENPIRQMNIAIHRSEKKFVLLFQQEWVFLNDVIYQLRKNLDFYQEYYAIGQIENSAQGGILVKREYLDRIAGFDETITSYSLGLDNLQKRMELAGIRKLYYPEALWFSYNNFSKESTLSEKKVRGELLLPVKAVVNNKSWVKGCNKILFDWRNNPYAAEQCQTYLQGLAAYLVPNSEAFNHTYKLIALIPVYNESERIEDCLRSVEKHCDGIIVLDDESTDGTYELVQSEKLLLKAKKKRTEFNDKQNRNILLDIAYFFRAEWFIFIDADERFDDRFVDLQELMQNPKIDVAGVWIANLWDSMETYRTDMLDSHLTSQNGLWLRWRMFRNKGRMQIIHLNKLHFPSVPFLQNTHISQILILHLGYLTLNKRNQKYLFYMDQDQYNKVYYNDILSETIKIQSLNTLNFSDYEKNGDSI
jgi:GT2 family glycosyltransferase